ncbi:hypothetical protein ACLKA7_003509 [Drosophila subpalustris]
MRSSSSFRRLRATAQLRGRDGGLNTPRPQQLRPGNLSDFGLMNFNESKATMSRNTVRWGIAPVTLMAEDFATALSVLPSNHHCITSCVDAYRSQGLVFADRHQVPNVFTSFEELAQCPQVDAVYICPSNPMHCELCHLMLNHDKHVLCEQPLCLTEDQVVELVAKAKARGLFLMEGIWSRCLPAYDKLRRELKNSQLGKIQHVECSLGWQMSNELTKSVAYAGVTRDLAPYAIQLALWVYRDVPQSMRVAGILNHEGVDVAANIELLFRGNRSARMILSTEQQLSNLVMIHGSKGSATLSNLWCPELLVLNNVDYKFALPQAKRATIHHNRVGICYEAEEVRQCILSGCTESKLFNHNESRLMANLTNQIHEMLHETIQNQQEFQQKLAI